MALVGKAAGSRNPCRRFPCSQQLLGQIDPLHHHPFAGRHAARQLEHAVEMKHGKARQRGKVLQMDHAVHMGPHPLIHPPQLMRAEPAFQQRCTTREMRHHHGKGLIRLESISGHGRLGHLEQRHSDGRRRHKGFIPQVQPPRVAVMHLGEGRTQRLVADIEMHEAERLGDLPVRCLTLRHHADCPLPAGQGALVEP